MKNNARSERLPSILDSEWERMALLVFALEVIAFIALSAVPLPPAIQSSLIQQYDSLQGVTRAPYITSALLIFSHNFLIASLELVPAIGTIWFVVSTAVTSVTISALGSSLGYPGPVISLTLFTLPHSWIELPAYAFATTEGIFVLMAFTRKSLRREANRFLSAWVLIGFTLIVAAFFESAEIKLEGINAFVPYATWIPFVILILIVAKLRHDAKARMAAPPIVYPGKKRAKRRLKRKKTKRISR